MLLLILSCVVIIPTTLLFNACTDNVEEDPIDDPTTTISTTATTTTTTTTNTTTTTTTDTTVTDTTATDATTTTFPSADTPISFPNTLFIGDSRTVGLRDYGKVSDATFFCKVGISSNNVTTKAIEVPGFSGEVTLSTVLDSKSFSTVYIMLGINEIGGGLSSIVQKYQRIIDLVHSKQPNATVVVQSTLHVTQKRHNDEINKNGYFNNNRINELNTLLQGLANGTTVQYLDMNPMFDDANGCLKAEAAAGDGIHIKAKYYLVWRSYLDEHRIA
jgi:hypothetical protein